MLETIDDTTKPVQKEITPGINESVVDVLTGEIKIDPEKIINTTQTVRTGILREITGHGTYLPTDKDTLVMTMQLMRDMDNTAQTATKLNIDEKNSVNSANVAALADMIIARSNIGSGVPTARPDPMLDIILPDVDLSAEELVQGESPLAPDDWLSDRD